MSTLRHRLTVNSPWLWSISGSTVLVVFSYLFYLYRTGVVAELYCSNSMVAIIGALSLYAAGCMLYQKFRHVGLSGVLLFLCYGLPIGWGVVYVMTGRLVWPVLLVGAPSGLLLAALLHASDTAYVVQDEGAQLHYQTMLLAAYLLVAIAVTLHLLHPLVFLVLVAFPSAITSIRLMKASTEGDPSLVARTAKLVLMFNLLLSAANFISPFL
jgi:1,4-dihydroxy-2-naphthoate octaprenyltransferase